MATVVLADINREALLVAQASAELAEVQVEMVHSDILRGVNGVFDLVIAPPYLR